MPRFLLDVPHGCHDVGRLVADVRAGGFDVVTSTTATCTGRARSAADIATGFCVASGLRTQIESRGDLYATTATVEETVAAQLGDEPTAEMTAHVVEARRD